MHEIHSDRFWIGHALDIRDARALFDMGIEAVVDVAYEEPPAQLPRQLIYCRFPLIDGAGNDSRLLLQATQTIVDLLDAGFRTIVACGAGMSRSPTIAAFGLAAHLDQSPDDVVLKIARGKTLDVSGPLWNDIADVYSRVRR